MDGNSSTEEKPDDPYSGDDDDIDLQPNILVVSSVYKYMWFVII